MTRIVSDFTHRAMQACAQSHEDAFSAEKIADALILEARTQSLTSRMRSFAEVRFCIAESSCEVCERAT